MQATGVRDRHWDPSELEEAVCFRCGVAGELVYWLPPFGVRACSRCGLVFVSPRLDGAGRKRLYDDEAYFEGDGSVYGHGAGISLRLQRLWADGRLDLLERELDVPLRSATLLEAGCAYGLFLARARQRGLSVTGQELSSPAAARVHDALGVRVHGGHLDELASERAFEVVCAWDVIEHVPDPGSFLEAARALTRPGGLIVLSCPYVTSPPARLLGARWWTLKPWEHIWHFSPATLRATAADARLSVRRLLTSPLRRANVARLDSMVAVLERPQAHDARPAAVTSASRPPTPS